MKMPEVVQRISDAAKTNALSWKLIVKSIIRSTARSINIAIARPVLKLRTMWALVLVKIAAMNRPAVDMQQPMIAVMTESSVKLAANEAMKLAMPTVTMPNKM